MANYYGKTRSNYFFVKDVEAFKSELSKYPVEIIEQQENGKTLYGFIDADDNGGGNIDYYYDEQEENNSDDLDWGDFFKRHLADGWVAIIMQTGSEKYCYLVGHATAYNNKGDIEFVSLDEIYSLATNIGENITRAEY